MLRLIGKYNGANVHSEFQCRSCGASMKIKPTYLQQKRYKRYCEKCGALFTSGNKQGALFELWLENAAPNISVIGEYKTLQDLLLFRCKKCNAEFLRKPKAIKKGAISCPECDRINRENELINWLKSNTDGVRLNSKYEDVRTSVSFLCSKCGHKWVTSPHHMKEYKKCPKCNRNK